MANHNRAATKPLRPRALTTKQKKFIKAKAEGKTNVAAAMEAYPTLGYKTASVVAAENLTKPSIQEALYIEFEKQGITLERIVRPIGEALDATKTVIIGKEEDAFADQVADHSIRLKASGMAAQFIGIGKSSEGNTTNFNYINLNDGDRDTYGL